MYLYSYLAYKVRVSPYYIYIFDVVIIVAIYTECPFILILFLHAFFKLETEKANKKESKMDSTNSPTTRKGTKKPFTRLQNVMAKITK